MLGRFLFRWREVIGLAAFGVVFWLARPTVGSCSAGLALVLAGLAVRFWASGYLGIEGRAREIGASRRIVSGPYRLLRHPLYIGNFLLVAGMLVALRPPLWLGAVVLVGFVVEYTLIVVAEEKDLTAKWKVERGNGKGAEEGEKWKVERGNGKGAEEGEKWKVERGNGKGVEEGKLAKLGGKSEAKSQKPKAKAAANGEWRRATGDSFSPARALCEWRTWVVTGVAFGLVLARALARR